MKKLSEKHIKKFAHGILNIFVSSCNHIAYLCSKNNIKVIEIDILNPKFSNDILNIDRNLNLAQMCNNNLKNNMKKLDTDGYIKSAVIKVKWGNIDEIKSGSIIYNSLFSLLIIGNLNQKIETRIKSDQMIIFS